MLKMIGMTQTIASDEAEYIDIAVRLASRPAVAAGNCVERIRVRHDNLYDDKLV